MRYVTIRPVNVHILDEIAARVFGVMFELPGGTELEGEHTPSAPLDASHTTLVVNDPYFPAMTVVVSGQYAHDALAPCRRDERGPRVGKDRQTCRHNLTRRDGREEDCLACYYRIWQARASALKITLAAGAAPTKEGPDAQHSPDHPKRGRRRPKQG
jgi:hypothetical protein